MIETLIAFFAFEAFGFWVLVAALCIGIICAIENDHELVPFIFIGVMGWLYHKELFSLVSIPWPAIAGCILGYVVAGIVWSVFKWKRYCNSIIKQDGMDRSDAKYKLALSHNKSKITGWLTYWPWSAAWTVGWGCTRDFWVYIYEQMEGVYKKIAEDAISKLPEPKLTKSTRSEN